MNIEQQILHHINAFRDALNKLSEVERAPLVTMSKIIELKFTELGILQESYNARLTLLEQAIFGGRQTNESPRKTDERLTALEQAVGCHNGVCTTELTGE